MCALGAIYEPGETVSICREVSTAPSAAPRTFWSRRISLISPANSDDSYNGSHYILHGTLILAVRLSQALSLSTLSREFPTRALPPTQVTVGLPQMDRVAVSSNLLRDFVSQVD